jgi:hypothetical protein
MINMYAYTYQSAIDKFIAQGYILTKVGDSHRDVDIRMDEQGGAAEHEEKIKMMRWNGLVKIERDYQIHRILTKRGFHHTKGKGTEWFTIPGNSVAEACKYLDELITEQEHRKVRKNVVLRKLQQRKLDQALDIIAKAAVSGKNVASILANLCPRFGKTVWALMLFNKISELYGNRVMLLPAYWLSVHSSFIEELDEYADFNDIAQIDVDEENAKELATKYLSEGLRIVIPISLHGDLTEWSKKHEWIAKIPNNDIYMFADEGDFGTHTENQVAKLKFLFDK